MEISISLRKIFNYDRGRILTHFGMGIVTFAGVLMTRIFKPELGLRNQVVIGLGYISLAMLVFTLLYGPYKLLKQRHLPMNYNLRRDVGIWTAGTGLLHVWWGLGIHVPEETPLLNFIKHHELHQGWVLRTDLGGWSNHLGLIATLILLMLLVLSNDLTLRLLKGKRWKFLQRFSYGLFLLVVAHALGYQLIVDRETILRITVILVLVFVLIVQLFGFVTYRTKKNRNKPAKDEINPV